MKFLAAVAVLMVVAACSPNLHTTEISEFSRSVGTLQTTLSTLAEQVDEAAIEMQSRGYLKEKLVPLDNVEDCIAQPATKCGLFHISDGSEFPPDGTGRKILVIVKSIAKYADSISDLTGSDDAKKVDKAIGKTKDALKSLIGAIKDSDKAAALNLPDGVLDKTPDIASKALALYLDRIRYDKLKKYVTLAEPVLERFHKTQSHLRDSFLI